MPGPEPAESRRRRNVPVKIADRVYLPPEGRKGAVPKPRLPRGAKVSALGREMWKSWWRSPQATQWHTGTAVYGLTRLLMMYEQLNAGELSARDQVEMRQLESQYGLNPKGMRELKWEIGDPQVSAPTPAASSSSAPRDQLEERRKRVAAAAAS